MHSFSDKMCTGTNFKSGSFWSNTALHFILLKLNSIGRIKPTVLVYSRKFGLTIINALLSVGSFAPICSFYMFGHLVEGPDLLGRVGGNCLIWRVYYSNYYFTVYLSISHIDIVICQGWSQKWL